MGKKSNNPHDNENPEFSPNPNSNPSIFQSLFGDVSVNDSTAASIFSDENPFRRKPIDSCAKSQKFELGFGVNGAEINGSELKKKKKEKEKEKEENSAVSGVDIEAEKQGKKKVESFEGKMIGGEKGREKRSRKKRKRDDIEAEYEAKMYGVKEEENVGPENGKVGEKRKKMDNAEELMVSKEGFDDESKLLRTVFVGNLPLKVKKKVLLKEFAKFGEIESVRIRSVPITDTKVPRKAAVLTKKLNENADCVHAYVVFKTEESAQASLAHNMAVVEGNHIRVDRACPPRKKMKGDEAPLYDHKKTVFVGNLPFDVKDEELYQLFCGIKNLETSVEAVRVVRDSNTLLGKGVAYVLFKTREAANVVAKKHLMLRDRELRLSRAKANSTPSKRKYDSNEDPNTSSRKKFAADSTPDKYQARGNLSYQGMRANKPNSQKKSRPKSGEKPKYQPKSPVAKKATERTAKRPAVAARKAKALNNASGSSKQGGTKRKMENRTPSSGARNKKLRKY